MINHGGKKNLWKLNLSSLENKMTDQNFQNLELEIKELMKVSRQLKEINDHLVSKNKLLTSENINLEGSISKAKADIKKVIKKIKDKK